MSASVPQLSFDQLMPKQIATAFIETLINQVLAQDNNAKAALSTLENRSLTVLINEIGFPLTLHVQQGHITVIANTLGDDCLIATNFATLAKLNKLQQLTSLIKSGELDIIGDVNVAQQFAAIKDQLNIDWQSLLAERIGDLPTHYALKVSRWLKQKFNFAQQQISADASEFLLHEAKLLASTAELQQFYRQVNNLTANTDALQQRIHRLSKTLTQQ